MINLRKDKNYLLACSYGPDSMALFDMLIKGNYKFSVAHINYNLRPESIKETEDLKLYCKKYKIDIYVKENKRKITKNIEENCREIRYKFFEKIYKKYDFDSLLVAHNEDDNIETYLMQHKRKNLVLFYGISCKSSLFSMEVIRPLLTSKKRDLMDYCKCNNVPFAIDSTNLQDAFLRNQIRHQIVEKLSDDERRLIIKEIENKNNELDGMLRSVKEFKNNDVNSLLQINDQVFPYLINDLARRNKMDCEVSSRLCNEIKKAIASSKPNVVVKIKRDYCFFKEYEHFRFDYLRPIEFSFIVNLGDVIDNDYFYFDTGINLEKRNLKKSDFPVTISNPKKGDEIKIKDYIVKLRRLFIDWKMPLSMRTRWPVIRDKNDTIVYVPRYQKDFDINTASGFYVKI